MSSDRTARLAWMKEEAKKRLLLLDGSWGVMIQGFKLKEEDFRGARFGNHASDVGDLYRVLEDVLAITGAEI